MTNKNEIVKDNVVQDTVLDSVAGGIITGIHKGEENTVIKLSQKRIDQMWEILKTRHEWQTKDRELDMQAKKMWMDAAFNLPDVIGKITGLFKGGA